MAPRHLQVIKSANKDHHHLFHLKRILFETSYFRDLSLMGPGAALRNLIRNTIENRMTHSS